MTSKKSFNIITVFSCFLLFALVLTCSILAVGDCQVASAFDSDGMVMPNLLEDNSLFDLPSGSTYGSLNLTENWILGGAGSNNRRIFDNSILTCSVLNTSGYYAYLRYDISDLNRLTDLHFRVQSYNSTNSRWLVQTWYYAVGSSSVTAGFSTGYQSNVAYLEGTFQLPDSSQYDRCFLLIQTAGFVRLNYAKLEYGSSFSGYVPKTYYNYGYKQGLDYNFNQGLELIEENSIRNDLSIDNAVSTGNINIPVNNSQLVTSQLSKMEQHTKVTNIYGPYDILDSGLLYNCLYPVTGQAGWYGARLNINLNGIYDFIPANSTFYLDIESSFGVYLSGSTYFKGRNKLFVCFFDSKNQLITLKDNVYSETNFCYNLANYNDLTDYSVVSSGFLNFTADFPTNYEDKALVCWIDTNSTMYFNLPYNVSYIGIFSYFDTDQTYYCYSGKLGYLPSSNYTAGYETGFEAGKNVGLTIGRNRGFQEASDYYDNYESDYSFMGLFTAVVDAPIKVLGDILDFEIFGYNMKAFLFSILAIALVLLIVKMFI